MSSSTKSQRSAADFIPPTGVTEDRVGKPFVGSAGKQLKDLCQEVRTPNPASRHDLRTVMLQNLQRARQLLSS